MRVGRALQPAPDRVGQAAPPAPAQPVETTELRGDALAAVHPGRQECPVLGRVQAVVAGEQLVRALAGEQHLDAGVPRQGGDLRHGHRALVHERELVVAHRRHQPLPPARGGHRRGAQLDPQPTRHPPRPRALVDGGLVGDGGVEGEQPRLLVAREGGDQAGVDAAGAHRPQRYVGHQTPPHGSAEARLDLGGQLGARPGGEGGGALAIDRGGGVVPAPFVDCQGRQLDVEQRPGQHAVDPLERRLAPVRPAVRHAVGEQVTAGARRHAGGQQGPQLAGEPQRPGMSRHVERLDPEAVAHE